MEYSKSKHSFQLFAYLANDFGPFGFLMESLKRTFTKAIFQGSFIIALFWGDKQHSKSKDFLC